MRRIIISAVLAVSALALTGALGARADTSSPPSVTQWSPQTVTPNGQPLRITIVGSNLAGVTQVFTSPVVAQRAVAVISDQAVVVTLPGNLEPGAYGLQLVSPSGSTLPGAITITVLEAAARPLTGGAGALPAAPHVSLQPAPVAVDAPAKPAAASGSASTVGVSPATAASVGVSGGVNPLLVLAIGIIVGGVLYMLWGKEGRLQLARRQGLLMQLWARPLQRLRLARICLQCGRLHYIVQTRSDLWAAGDFCSATCFVADQEKEHELASSEGVAPTRLRGVGVYTDLEVTLQNALRAEATEHAASLFGSEGPHNSSLLPVPASSEKPVQLSA